MANRAWASLWQYAAGVGAIAIATALRVALNPVLGGSFPFATLFLAILVVAWRGGHGPALFATLLGAVAWWLFLLPAANQPPITGDFELAGLAMYMLVGLGIAALGGSMRAARIKAEGLAEKIAQRQIQLEEAQSDLRRQGERLRVTLASIGDAVISTDALGQVTFVNEVAARLTGWTQAESSGRPLSEVFRVVNEHTGEECENPALRALREGVVVGLANHTMLVSRDGSRRPIDDSAAPILDGSGVQLGAVLVFRDISEQKEAIDAQSRLAAIVESSDDAIVSKTLDGIIRTWNVGAQRLFGYLPEEAIGRHISLIIPHKRLGEEHEIIARIARGDRVEHFETERVSKDGRRVEISLTVSPILDKRGAIVGASKIARDISERRRTERLLRESDRRKDEFIALLAHELRNPLAPLRNGLEVIRLAGDDAQVAEPTLDMMDRQLGHMVRLIDDLLDISRISRNKMELRRSRASLAEIVDNAIETARPAIEEANHELTVSLPSDPIYLDADLTRLAQVIGNLLTNSAKYTTPKGRIWLSAERQGSEVVLSVRDDGIGIPVEALPRIFDMFSQVDRSIERSAGGLGIGLALVKALVEMHGGTVTAASEGLGKGSTFTVRLPALAAGDDTSREEPAASEPPAARPSRRVLIVDDNLDIAKSMTAMLRLMGDDVRAAHDGIAAVETAEEFRPNVILMDVGMPRLNGYEATQRIRQAEWGKGMIIVALTGWGQPHDRLRSNEAGCDGHLVKPVRLPELERLLADLERGRA